MFYILRYDAVESVESRHESCRERVLFMLRAEEQGKAWGIEQAEPTSC
jgi:hypothetical protein